jgi:hypothetical protein
VPVPNVDEMKAQKDVAGLIAALRDGEATVRYHAVQALDELRDLRAVGPLTFAMRDEAMPVRARAAEALIDALHKERDDVREAAADALTALLGERAQRAVKLYHAERDRRDAERRGEVTPRAHKQIAAFCTRWGRDVTLIRGFYSFFDVCEGSLEYVARPCENYHCLYHDVLVSGFWLRNEMGVTGFTAKADAYRAMQAQGAVDYTRRS